MNILSAVFVLFVLHKAVEAPPISVSNISESTWHSFWIFRLLVNLFGYATVFLPSYLLFKYLKKIKYNKQGLCFPCVKICVYGDESITIQSNTTGAAESVTFKQKLSSSRKVIQLIFCAIGLQVSYLTWGLIQERVMTREYGELDGIRGEKFTNSQFLVFVNRLLACTLAGLYILIFRQPGNSCPFYKFSFASFSNVMSSWFQYEALKFVTFPTQVLGKASKVIPVMIMGKVVSGNVYELYEWITAGMLSAGVSLFLLSNENHHADANNTIDANAPPLSGMISGFILMLGYMTFDSFTSNWQGKLFKVHRIAAVQMMFGVTLFSCIFTSTSLLQQGGFFEAFSFMMKHKDFAFHSLILSVCSGVGQIFIFYTLSKFGAIVFTIIMTLRQAFAILLSCIIYGHPLNISGIFGVVVVFIALFLRIYFRNRQASK